MGKLVHPQLYAAHGGSLKDIWRDVKSHALTGLYLGRALLPKETQDKYGLNSDLARRGELLARIL